MSSVINLTRHWIPLESGSCDVRMGYGALDQASTLFVAAVGTPRRCMAIVRASVGEDQRELLRRQLVSAGFEVFWHLVGAGHVRTFDQAHELIGALAENGFTKDDLCCVFGDADVISVAAFVASTWCGGMPIVAIPTDEVALLEGALAPRALDVGDKRGMLVARDSVHHVLLDYDLACSDVASEPARYARVLMVSAAMGGSERVFSDLWDRADALVRGDEEVTHAQLMDTAKSRGQTLSSAAAAIRQSIEYGQAFARAVECATQTAYPASHLLAEGLRFSGRLGVALEKLSLDDMLAQDELLDMLGIGTLTCSLSAEQLVDALKQELFSHANRCMLLIPHAIGRVRLATIPDDMLLEHAAAWCAAHATDI